MLDPAQWQGYGELCSISDGKCSRTLIGAVHARLRLYPPVQINQWSSVVLVYYESIKTWRRIRRSWCERFESVRMREGKERNGRRRCQCQCQCLSVCVANPQSYFTLAHDVLCTYDDASPTQQGYQVSDPSRSSCWYVRCVPVSCTMN